MADDYDSPWKEMLEGYFPAFLAFFFPKAYADIDWNRGYESLDGELQKVTRDAAAGRRLADKLFTVWRKSGERMIIFIHVEIQGHRDEGFPCRMFTYNYRVFDQRQEYVVSLAILGDDNPGWRPDRFGWEVWDCEVGIRFPVVKLWEYNERWGELEGSSNPFAVVVMAHLKTKATRRSPADRLHWKTYLVRRLFERGYERRDVLELFRFIDWMLTLPAELEEKFQIELRNIETERNMPYITTIERMGIEKGMQEGIREGIQKGIQKGEAAILKRQLARRFEQLPDWVEPRLRKASRKELERWAERLLDAATLDEVFDDAP